MDANVFLYTCTDLDASGWLIEKDIGSQFVYFRTTFFSATLFVWTKYSMVLFFMPLSDKHCDNHGWNTCREADLAARVKSLVQGAHGRSFVCTVHILAMALAIFTVDCGRIRRPSLVSMICFR